MLQNKMIIGAMSLLAAATLGSTANSAGASRLQDINLETETAHTISDAGSTVDGGLTYTFETEDGILIGFDSASDVMMESKDGGKTWTECEGDLDIRMEENMDAASSINLETEDGTMLRYDDETGILSESRDGGKTWTAFDGDVQFMTEEGAEDGEVLINVSAMGTED